MTEMPPTGRSSSKSLGACARGADKGSIPSASPWGGSSPWNSVVVCWLSNSAMRDLSFPIVPSSVPRSKLLGKCCLRALSAPQSGDDPTLGKTLDEADHGAPVLLREP